VSFGLAGYNAFDVANDQQHKSRHDERAPPQSVQTALRQVEERVSIFERVTFPNH
jgi:hypothetical protein